MHMHAVLVMYAKGLTCLPVRLEDRQGGQPSSSGLLLAAHVAPATVWFHCKRPFTGVRGRREVACGSLLRPNDSACRYSATTMSVSCTYIYGSENMSIASTCSIRVATLMACQGRLVPLLDCREELFLRKGQPSQSDAMRKCPRMGT